MRQFAKLSLFVIALLLGNYTISLAQDKVESASLKGKYEGEEKKGLANGKGKAIGKDTYEGEFSKGLPDGKGVYTWGEDLTLAKYEGKFKKGKKEGEGKLTLKDGTVKEGIFMNDEFAYSVSFVKGQGISRVSVKKGTGTENTIVFPSSVRIPRNGIDPKFDGGTFKDVSYPFKKDLEIDINGKFVKFTIEIAIPGTWNVSIYQ